MPKLITKTVENNVSSKLNSLMKEKGFNISQLSKATGIAVGTIQKILNDPHSNPTYTTLKALSDALKVSIITLLGEKNTSVDLGKKIKIIEWEHVMDFVNDFTNNTTTNSSFVVSNLELSSHAFALKFIGEDAASFFRENTILIFDPNKIPYNRCFVLVKFHGHEMPTLKQLIIEEPTYYLKSLNPEFAHEKIKPLGAKDKIIATLVQSVFNH